MRGLYLKHVGVFVVAVLHHYRVVPGQRVGDAVLAFTVHSLQYNKEFMTCYSLGYHIKHDKCISQQLTKKPNNIFMSLFIYFVFVLVNPLMSWFVALTPDMRVPKERHCHMPSAITAEVQLQSRQTNPTIKMHSIDESHPKS